MNEKAKDLGRESGKDTIGDIKGRENFREGRTGQEGHILQLI